MNKLIVVLLTSYIYTQTLKDNGITISMDSKGRATDNICIV
jgi:putative transposase